MSRPLWLESSAGARLYVAAERVSDGWAVRLFDRNGKRASRIVYRVLYESTDDTSVFAMSQEVPAEIVADLMHEMRRQVNAREGVFLAPPLK